MHSQKKTRNQISSLYGNLWVHLKEHLVGKRIEKKLKNQWLEVWWGVIPSKVIEDYLFIYKNTVGAMSSKSSLSSHPNMSP